MTIKTHGRMMTSDTIGITQLDLQDGTANQAIVTDGQGVLRFATVGAGGSVGSSVYVEDIRTGDGSTVTFTLSTAAPYEESILVFIDGVAQPTDSFTLPSTTSLTFSPAPGNGAAIRICHLGIASSVADCSITGAKICMGGDTPGDILFYNGTSYQRLTIGTALQVLATNTAANAPNWVDAATAALPATGVDGNVLTSDGTNWNSETPLGGVGGELVSVQQFVYTTDSAVQTWTRPSGVKRIEVYLIGAGGQTYSINDVSPAGSGGGAGQCYTVLDVTNIATASVVIGNSTVVQAPTTAFRNSTFSGTGITTMTASGGGDVSSAAAPGLGGAATGGALNFVGEHGSHAQTSTGIHTGGGHSGGQRIGEYGTGAQGSLGSGSTPVSHQGGSGYCLIKEYSDVSASLVGENLISSQLLTTAGAGTWTKPANITKIEVWVVGAGGGSNSTNTHAGGGGGGGTAYSILDVTNIATAPYVVGTASTAAGNLSSFNTTIIGGGGGGATDGAGSGGGTGSGAGMQISFTGATGGFSANDGIADGGESWFGGIYGRGAVGAGDNLSNSGSPGCVYIKEYSDPSLVSGGLSGVYKEEYITLPTAMVGNATGTAITGVWTKPAGVTQIDVRLLGAGAGGGRNIQTGGAGIAPTGGTGAFINRVIDVRDLTTIDYYVGIAGRGANQAGQGGNAGVGGNVSFGHNGTAHSTGLTVTVDGSGAITAITNPGSAGSGMTRAPIIFIEPNTKIIGSVVGGSGATATATISGGAVTGITVTNGGSGYVQGSVIATFGLNAIGGTAGGNTSGGSASDPVSTASQGLGYGNKGFITPWFMGSSSVPGASNEFGTGGSGGGVAGGNGLHGGMYIRSYK